MELNFHRRCFGNFTTKMFPGSSHYYNLSKISKSGEIKLETRVYFSIIKRRLNF
jgi:hypothetical protein